MIPTYFEMDKRLEEEELQVTDWEILMGFVASGVEPRGINLVDGFYDEYKKIFEKIKRKGYFQIIKDPLLYICKEKLMVIWITGISGAGKTTLAVFLKNKKFQSVYFDGTNLEKILGNDIKYTLKDRDINAHRLTRLVKYLSDQKLNIIISANLTSENIETGVKKILKII